MLVVVVVAPGGSRSIGERGFRNASPDVVVVVALVASTTYGGASLVLRRWMEGVVVAVRHVVEMRERDYRIMTIIIYIHIEIMIYDDGQDGITLLDAAIEQIHQEIYHRGYKKKR